MSKKSKISRGVKLKIAALHQQKNRVSRFDPYGADLSPDGKTLIANLAEEEWIRKMVAWRKKKWGTQKIANTLNEQGVRPKRAEKWGRSSVEAVLRLFKLRGMPGKRSSTSPQSFVVNRPPPMQRLMLRSPAPPSQHRTEHGRQVPVLRPPSPVGQAIWIELPLRYVAPHSIPLILVTRA